MLGLSFRLEPSSSTFEALVTVLASFFVSFFVLAPFFSLCHHTNAHPKMLA